MQTWNNYIEHNKERFVKELSNLLRIPSISAQSKNESDMKTCANYVKQTLINAGADKAEIHSTNRHPIVYAEKIIDTAKPTVLVYGHYDVQPPEPLELWRHPPFNPTIKNNKIFARGASDDKGQFFMHVKALEILSRTNSLPLNLKFIIEGEEEIGSPSLAEFVKTNKSLLKTDMILISDSAMISLDTPSIDVGVRGMLYIEVEVTGANRDLHSGTYGGAVANPITILAEMIASLHDENNHITISHFYDDVLELPIEEKKELAKAPFDEMQYKQELGIDVLWGESGFTTMERTGIRPTLEVNGIWGGYTDEGAKTVLPSKAYAKISYRLVPNQKSDMIEKLVVNHLYKIAPSSVTINIKTLQRGNAYITPVNSIEYKAAAKAMEETLGKTPVPVRGGGSIPIAALFEKELGCKIIFLGFGLDNDNLHSPNEKFDLNNFYKGIETILHFHKYYSTMKQ